MRHHPHFWAYVSLISVCFFWGTTYLSIRMALESFPPLVLVASRFTISGALLLAAAFLKNARLPRGRELWLTALNGVIILGIGNAALTYAETWIASGLAALILTTSPFWLVGIEALVPGGERLHAPTVAGMLIGLGGAALLVGPGVMDHGGGHSLLKGFLVLQLGCMCWCGGSIAQRRQVSRAHPVVSGGVQQLAAGVVFLVLALLIREHPIRWSFRGGGALIYLVLFGSIVGYSAYIYALDKLPVAVVSIYTYINPVVAVFLGWLFYREPFGAREAAAMGIIFAGVAVVKKYARAARAE
ncbi:MAG: EamA family transporter [Bryobacterales bacterium]|nr:EamA family transporter [Bryobacterales bacterium]